MDGQISIFQIMDQYETERLPYEACKAGVIAWTIECAAITNSWDAAAPVLYITAKPRKIRFKRDSEMDKWGWCTYYDSIDSGNYFGGWGSRVDAFAAKPTVSDCERYAREHYRKDKRITAETPFRP